MGEDRFTLGELGRVLLRVDERTERIEQALFFGDGDTPSLMTRVDRLEQDRRDDRSERRLGRVMIAIGTFVGSMIGAASAGLVGGHK